TRIRPRRPSASLTASTRAVSAASGWPRSATFTLAVWQPEPATIACARPGPTAGTVTLTGTWLRTGAGQAGGAAPGGAAGRGAPPRGPYRGNGDTPPQPAGPSISAPSLTAMPRKRVRMGIANARRPGSRPAASAVGPSVTGAAGTWRSRGGASP